VNVFRLRPERGRIKIIANRQDDLGIDIAQAGE
jgi:hypothetical protein